ncbi:hypothetical protein [Streptomyces sp. DSM 40750]|uniref:hypothetical protein n=1 Tax=Streptomyces sp. DSM 40750 TaxID=2801030 RepID=UPI00214B47D1|nr:hypothetical protein [Streptomyces sp. DSM 40750]UUU26910.1 hypothetical protein JIX55_45540 [Streptomyces sp. DSM 40750]
MNRCLLLSSFIRAELGVDVPPTHITGENSATLRTITDMVLDLPSRSASPRSAAPPGPPPSGGTSTPWDSAG